MKIRSAFVANSSSSSFIIDVSKLTNAGQVHQIVNHISEAGNMPDIEYADWMNEWTIEYNEKNNTLHGFTTMDNFDMSMFLKHIGVPAEAIEWDVDDWDLGDSDDWVGYK